MDLKINMEFYNVTKDSNKEYFPAKSNGAGIAEIASTLIDMKEEATIVKLTLPITKCIHLKMFRDLMISLKSLNNNYVLFGTTYLTVEEFPEDEYYDATDKFKEKYFSLNLSVYYFLICINNQFLIILPNRFHYLLNNILLFSCRLFFPAFCQYNMEYHKSCIYH